MSTVTMDVGSFEMEMLQRAHDATMLSGIFEVAKTTTVTLFCSDCCGSNGNSCIPQIDPGIN